MRESTRRRPSDATHPRHDGENRADEPSQADVGSYRVTNPRPEHGRPRRTLHETSAGGLVVAGIDARPGQQMAALIGRAGRRGQVRWSLPKGHVEVGETPGRTAIREIGEETGIRAKLLAPLGTVDYWFVTDDHRVHKTVHHYLLRFLGGELCTTDDEVDAVAWVPLSVLSSRLVHADERRLAYTAIELIDALRTRGAAALPPMPHHLPQRYAQTHSRARR